MPLPVVVRLGLTAAQAEQVRALPDAVVVLPQFHEDDVQALMTTFSAASKQARNAFRRGQALVLLSAGPLLDQPDRVSVQTFAIEHRQLELLVSYTKVRTAGVSLERNLPWRPLVKLSVPSDLVPGSYTVKVGWVEAVSDAPTSQRSAPTMPLEQFTSFELYK